MPASNIRVPCGSLSTGLTSMVNTRTSKIPETGTLAKPIAKKTVTFLNQRKWNKSEMTRWTRAVRLEMKPYGWSTASRKRSRSPTPVGYGNENIVTTTRSSPMNVKEPFHLHSPCSPGTIRNACFCAETPESERQPGRKETCHVPFCSCRILIA